MVVMMGWVLFRADTFVAAKDFFLALFGLGGATAAQPLARYATNQVIWALVLGIPFSGPLWGWIKTGCVSFGQALPLGCRPAVQVLGSVLEVTLIAALLLISAVWLAGGTYNPFIYFRF